MNRIRKTTMNQHHIALNAPPIPNVGKTGYYVRTGGTIYRFPRVVTIGNETVHGHRLPHAPHVVKRNKYVPHVGAKQKAKMATN